MQGIIDVPATDGVPDLSWLADSPVFIDGQQVGAFYDAVVGPAFRTVELQVTASWAEQFEKSAAGHLNAGLSALFPWLKVDAGMEARKAATRTRQDGQSITVQPVDSAARQLVQLSLHYLVNQPGRICVVDQNTSFPGAEAIAVSPRMIAFVDVPAGTRFLPQAAELNDGRVVTFFSPLIEKLKRDGGTLPVAYPESTTTDAGRCRDRRMVASPVMHADQGGRRPGCRRSAPGRRCGRLVFAWSRRGRGGWPGSAGAGAGAGAGGRGGLRGFPGVSPWTWPRPGIRG
jgi:hypothetical protein